jgi:hypothetical protein
VQVEEQLKRPPAGCESISIQITAIVPKPSDGPNHVRYWPKADKTIISAAGSDCP